MNKLKSPLSHLMLGYWTGLMSPGPGTLLENDILEKAAPYLFVSCLDARNRLRLVAGGTRIRELTTETLSGFDYASFWHRDDQILVEKLAKKFCDEGQPICFAATGRHNSHQPIRVDCMLFPSERRADQPAGLLGAFFFREEETISPDILPLRLERSDDVLSAITSGATDNVFALRQRA